MILRHIESRPFTADLRLYNNFKNVWFKLVLVILIYLGQSLFLKESQLFQFFESINCFTIYMVWVRQDITYFESKIVSTVLWVKIEISFESILLGGGGDMKSICNVWCHHRNSMPFRMLFWTFLCPWYGAVMVACWG